MAVKEDAASQALVNRTPVAVAPTVDPDSAADLPRMRINWGKIEDIAFQKYFGARSLQTLEVIREVKLTERDQAFDPISNMPIVFDAFVIDGQSEIFVEFKSATVSLMFRDRLYVMLSKIHHYRITKKVAAQLDLVVIRVAGESDRGGN